jgi:hypothetical protein
LGGKVFEDDEIICVGNCDDVIISVDNGLDVGDKFLFGNCWV